MIMTFLDVGANHSNHISHLESMLKPTSEEKVKNESIRY
jgi:hypothetical protein